MFFLIDMKYVGYTSLCVVRRSPLPGPPQQTGACKYTETRTGKQPDRVERYLRLSRHCRRAIQSGTVPYGIDSGTTGQFCTIVRVYHEGTKSTREHKGSPERLPLQKPQTGGCRVERSARKDSPAAPGNAPPALSSPSVFALRFCAVFSAKRFGS